VTTPTADTTVLLGWQSKLYYSTGGIGTSPTWVEVPEVQDVKLGLDKKMTDVTIRGLAGTQAEKGALKVTSIEFKVPYIRNNAHIAALVAAYFSNAALGFGVADGDIATSATTNSYQAECEISKIDWPQDHDKNQELTITAVPTLPSATAGVYNAPKWVPAGGA